MGKTIVVTGGCGFIGSHIVDRLIQSNDVKIIDNLSLSSAKFVDKHVKDGKVKLMKCDITKPMDGILDGADIAFHMAACSDVRIGNTNPDLMFDVNVTGTFNVLEACRKSGVKKITFASSSVVYGNAMTPTPESAPIRPVSLYGYTKAFGEMLLKNYSDLYGIKCVIVRYANVFGPRSTHGIMFDFYNKLKKNPNELEILGNGKQRKSYVFVGDAVDATLLATENSNKSFDAFNIGTEETMDVNQIADDVIKHMHLNGVQKTYTGGEVGWKGDIPVMLLDTAKIRSLGWKPQTPAKDGIRKFVEWMERAGVDL